MISSDKIYGLVLSGGKSTRMGQDKGLIPYHGMPQREYLYGLLSTVCEKTCMSIRRDQLSDLPTDIEVIFDDDEFKGPFNGLLSAHKHYPDVAWLVLACDMPLIDMPALKELIAARNPAKKATAFASKENHLPEPLCAIWEPIALSESIDYLRNGNGTCPRKYLINSTIELVVPRNEQVLLNANSETEYKEAMIKLLAV